MMSARLMPLVMLLAAPAALPAQPAPASAPATIRDEAAVNRLVDHFAAARLAFDPAALSRLIASDYVEISPVGEVDSRAQVLGFYAPDKKQPAPAMTLDERSVRVFDRTAILTCRTSFGPAAMRVVHLARRVPAGWQLVSVQYTPIRSPRPT